MKAVILNSGIGKRLGAFTQQNHKSMTRLSNGETLFGRQLRLLVQAGVEDVAVTTGPFAYQLAEVAAEPHLANLKVAFVANPDYASTNYIYSLFLARDQLDDDVLLMHGDLVFNRAVVTELLADPRPDLGVVDETAPLPDKDFKARIAEGVIREVSVSAFGPDCVAFQPLYKLSRRAMKLWLDRMERFVEAGSTQVYAENAFNEISDQIDLAPFSYSHGFVAEIDTFGDLAGVAPAIRLFDFKEQPVFEGDSGYHQAKAYLERNCAHGPLLVCDAAFDDIPGLSDHLVGFGLRLCRFSDFGSNPTYEQVVEGVKTYQMNRCDSIVAVGGGSAMDVAKCIKLFVGLSPETPYYQQNYRYAPIPHVAIPTTAGTGSESTHFAVCYIDGDKHSIAHDSLMPDLVVLDPHLLKTLPDYHKKSTMLDALCQCIESIWARNATDESRDYAGQGLRLILDNWRAYIEESDESAATQILRAANLSGKAINLSQTTAPHAMSYKLSQLFGIAHGHAVAICTPPVWRLLINSETVLGSLRLIASAFDVATPEAALTIFEDLFARMNLAIPSVTDAQLDSLAESVNSDRLSNHPERMSMNTLRDSYRCALLPARVH
jgi:alcohol dehydrogenase class IV/choline kinase